MAITRRQMIIEWLENHGCYERQSRSKKYKEFYNPKLNKIYWVGKNGAVRTGNSISKSISITHRFGFTT